MHTFSSLAILLFHCDLQPANALVSLWPEAKKFSRVSIIRKLLLSLLFLNKCPEINMIPQELQHYLKTQICLECALFIKVQVGKRTPEGHSIKTRNRQ